MNNIKTAKLLETLEMIATDAENDIRESEGQPFNGRNTHVLFGKQAAAINALAKILQLVIED